MLDEYGTKTRSGDGPSASEEWLKAGGVDGGESSPRPPPLPLPSSLDLLCLLRRVVAVTGTSPSLSLVHRLTVCAQPAWGAAVPVVIDRGGVRACLSDVDDV